MLEKQVWKKTADRDEEHKLDLEANEIFIYLFIFLGGENC